MTNVYEGRDGEFPVEAEEPAALPPVELSEEDLAGLQVVKAACARWNLAEPVEIELENRYQAFLLMGALQLAFRHPAQPFRDVIERMGRQIQDAICDREDIYLIAESGWRR